jgi:hypothetical protein
MKITKRQLRRIIKEEKRKVLNEQDSVNEVMDVGDELKLVNDVTAAVLDAVYEIMFNRGDDYAVKQAIAAGIMDAADTFMKDQGL